MWGMKISLPLKATILLQGDQTGLAAATDITAHPYTDNRVMKTSWFQNNLLTYQFFVDGKPTPAAPVYVRNGYSENLAKLSRAWHFGHKSRDESYLNLLDDEGTYHDQNFILGQEFESVTKAMSYLVLALTAYKATAEIIYDRLINVTTVCQVFKPIDAETSKLQKT